MSMEDLYQEMKEVLKYFGLSFGHKDEVKVYIQGQSIIFYHSGRTISFRIEAPAT